MAGRFEYSAATFTLRRSNVAANGLTVDDQLTGAVDGHEALAEVARCLLDDELERAERHALSPSLLVAQAVRCPHVTSEYWPVRSCADRAASQISLGSAARGATPMLCPQVCCEHRPGAL
jgi:hypothetical protein